MSWQHCICDCIVLCAMCQNAVTSICCTSKTRRTQVFTESTHIVAIRTSGNVYAYEAVQELNIKPKFMKDLLTDQPFTRKDIIHIQDPMNLEASACMLQFLARCSWCECPVGNLVKRVMHCECIHYATVKVPSTFLLKMCHELLAYPSLSSAGLDLLSTLEIYISCVFV